MTVVFTNRSHTDVAVLRDRAPLFVTLADGSIRNGYTFKVANKSRENRTYELSVKGLPGAEVNVIGEGEGEQAGGMHINAAPDSVATYRVYVKVPRASVTAASTPLTFTLNQTGGREKDSYTTVFLGPN
jgi:polyferredoxin